MPDNEIHVPCGNVGFRGNGHFDILPESVVVVPVCVVAAEEIHFVYPRPVGGHGVEDVVGRERLAPAEVAVVVDTAVPLGLRPVGRRKAVRYGGRRAALVVHDLEHVLDHGAGRRRRIYDRVRRRDVARAVHEIRVGRPREPGSLRAGTVLPVLIAPRIAVRIPHELHGGIFRKVDFVRELRGVDLALYAPVFVAERLPFGTRDVRHHRCRVERVVRRKLPEGPHVSERHPDADGLAHHHLVDEHADGVVVSFGNAVVHVLVAHAGDARHREAECRIVVVRLGRVGVCRIDVVRDYEVPEARPRAPVDAGARAVYRDLRRLLRRKVVFPRLERNLADDVRREEWRLHERLVLFEERLVVGILHLGVFDVVRDGVVESERKPRLPVVVVEVCEVHLHLGIDVVVVGPEGAEVPAPPG